MWLEKVALDHFFHLFKLHHQLTFLTPLIILPVPWSIKRWIGGCLFLPFAYLLFGRMGFVTYVTIKYCLTPMRRKKKEGNFYNGRYDRVNLGKIFVFSTPQVELRSAVQKFPPHVL